MASRPQTRYALRNRRRNGAPTDHTDSNGSRNSHEDNNSSDENDKDLDRSSLDAGRYDSYAHNTFRVLQDDNEILFREKPRQLTMLVIVIAALAYYSFTHDTQDDKQNLRTALATALLIFLVYCFLQTRDSLLVRPHPGLWRIVHGCGVAYLVLLAGMAVQNRESAMKAMQILFPEVGVQPTTQPGALDCTLNYQNIKKGVSSIWFLAHVTGWWGKMCMFRDWRFCWVLSVFFELLELSLQFTIPDFQECWWDSLLLDSLGANLIGMCLGRLTLRILESKDYDWSGRKDKKTGYFVRVLQQFTPVSWSQYHWEVFSSFQRLAQVVFAIVTILLIELNAFFLLTSLEVPKESDFNAYRLSLIFLLGIPAAAEYYEFLSNPNCRRIGQNAWLVFSIASLEVLNWVKFGTQHPTLFSNTPSRLVYGSILLFLSLFILWTYLYFHSSKKKSEESKWTKLDILFWLAFTPLLVLPSQWAF